MDSTPRGGQRDDGPYGMNLWVQEKQTETQLPLQDGGRLPSLDHACLCLLWLKPRQ